MLWSKSHIFLFIIFFGCLFQIKFLNPMITRRPKLRRQRKIFRQQGKIPRPDQVILVFFVLTWNKNVLVFTKRSRFLKLILIKIWIDFRWTSTLQRGADCWSETWISKKRFRILNTGSRATQPRVRPLLYCYLQAWVVKYFGSCLMCRVKLITLTKR